MPERNTSSLVLGPPGAPDRTWDRHCRQFRYVPNTTEDVIEMVVTGKVHNMRQLGPYIYRLCNGRETYRLKRRSMRRRECARFVSGRGAGGVGSPITFDNRKWIWS